MTPQTRTRNKDANFKAFYSKKPQKQRYFPSRRKTVRDKVTVHQPGSEPRQMTFLPEQLRRNSRMQHSEDEDGEAEFATTDEENTKEQRSAVVEQRGKKRTVDVTEAESSEDEGPIRPISKRRKGTRKTKKRELPRVKTEIDVQDAGPESYSLRSESEAEPTEEVSRIRQSTMTQLVEGRKPHRGDKEPSFKALRRGPRTSWGNAKNTSKEHDRQQRTLTQMVPGLIPIGTTPDQDSESELEERAEGLGHTGRDEEGYNASIAEHLTQQGLFEPMKTQSPNKKLSQSQVRVWQNRSRIVQDSDQDEDGISDDSAAQDASLSMSKQKRSSPFPFDTVQRSVKLSAQSRNQTARTRFGLLATPEKRRVMEIPSSQSPSGSPLSTQVTPSKRGRDPLRERTVNTPSKRRVAFQEIEQPTLKSPRKTKFGSVVMDSEDDGEDFFDDNLAVASDLEDQNSEPQPQVTNSLHLGEDIGVETQAILQDIDCACANPENIKEDRRSSSIRSNRPEALDVHSSPICIKHEPEEEDDLLPFDTAPHQFSNDLDGDPIQVPRSPPIMKSETQSTNTSESIRAERQIQSEWQSYSQYQRAPPSSSMYVDRESDPFSYQATPFANHGRGNAPYHSLHNFSQATTVDFSRPSPHTTPRKPRSVRASATPHKVPNSQPSISPQKPPTLFIPSSFPSPGHAGGESWTSPILGRSHGGRGLFSQLAGMESVEDFSIPPLPPIDDDDMFE
ncbi:hypothetical protein B0J11DRAFT_174679 [Dendryphion nanum]|uniref:Uncharacterized protein n=1 Tax=Dendryphion nanum TaxID=256645 RepID=A0A9P9EDK5_9PLEO|nr:hypothetical protein B0J11DRAFT_174679 [Dendryphion nanum]